MTFHMMELEGQGWHCEDLSLDLGKDGIVILYCILWVWVGGCYLDAFNYSAIVAINIDFMRPGENQWVKEGILLEKAQDCVDPICFH